MCGVVGKFDRAEPACHAEARTWMPTASEAIQARGADHQGVRGMIDPAVHRNAKRRAAAPQTARHAVLYDRLQRSAPTAYPSRRSTRSSRSSRVTAIPLAPGRRSSGLVNPARKNRHGREPETTPGRRMCRRPSLRVLAVGVDHCGESFALVVDSVGDVLMLDRGTQIEIPPHPRAMKREPEDLRPSIGSTISSFPVLRPRLGPDLR